MLRRVRSVRYFLDAVNLFVNLCFSPTILVDDLVRFVFYCFGPFGNILFAHIDLWHQTGVLVAPLYDIVEILLARK